MKRSQLPMSDRDNIERLVYRAIDRVNDMLLDDSSLAKEPSTVLIGDNAQLDSLGYINFVLALEDEVTQAMRIDLSLADELILRSHAASQETVEGMIDFILLLTQGGEAERA